MIRRFYFTICCLCITLAVSAQTTLTGTVYDEYLEPFPGANVKTSEGQSVSSDFDGVFTIKVKSFPMTLTVSAVGQNDEVVEVENESQELNIILKEALSLDQVVISASRTPERVMESPVTIERMGTKGIKNSASPNFYEGLGNLKGIDVLADSYNVKTVVSNRGFGNSLNVRFIQLVDGAETTVPILDYSFGNTFGLSELDVKNVEILPGAASALYGANAFNGIMLMTSKSPFDYTGISTALKSGVTTQDDRGSYAFYDTSIRMAHKFNDVLAAKVNFRYSKGEEWSANDYRSSTGQGGGIIEGTSELNRGDIDYDGVNVYGDEVSVDLDRLALSSAEQNPLLAEALAANPGILDALSGIDIARTGYLESELFSDKDTEAKNVTLDAAVHLRPWKNSTEFILSSKFMLLDNILHASNRYKQSEAYQGQYKAELRGETFFVRGYYTINDAGNTWDTRVAGLVVNNAWKTNEDYYQEFSADFFANKLPRLLSDPTQLANKDAIKALAVETRSLIEQGKIQSGSPAFNQALAFAKNTNISEDGAKVIDNSGFINVDVNWNLVDYIDFANVLVGGSYRKYILDSGGQVYTDDDGNINYRSFGFYTQMQKKFAEDRLKVTGTIRFDKSDNFDGNFSPRVSLSYAAGEKKDHNFRFAFQTGFRNPTTQDQYIGIPLGGDRIFLGTVEENLSREITDVTYRDGTPGTLTGIDAFKRSYSAESYEEFLSTRDPNVLEQADVDYVVPEIVRSFELGYRGAASLGQSLLEFDLVGFYNFHEDFITTKDVIVPYDGDIGSPASIQALTNQESLRYVLRLNAKSKVDAYGFAAGVQTKFSGFDLGASYAYADHTVDYIGGEDKKSFKAAFNAPKHKVKVQFGKDKLVKNFGFNIAARWQDEFLYESFYVDGVVEARTVLDAQLNYRIPSLKSTIKVGGTNLGGKNYISVPGTGIIGSQYFASLVIND